MYLTIQSRGEQALFVFMGTCSVRYMEPTTEQIEAELHGWRQQEESRAERRIDLVRRAHAAGFNIRKIHLISGIGRTTIYRDLESTP